MQLYDLNGKRLYLTQEERKAFLKAADKAPRIVRTFCHVLAYTGCRISEALALVPSRIDFSGKVIIYETLKKRRKGVYRAVPVSDGLLDLLDMVHGLRETVKSKPGTLEKPIWSWSRMTAWRKIEGVLEAAGIAEGPHRCPKGLRHGYGVAAISSGVPLNLLSKWMGHASLEVTAIYANAQGEEQWNIAARMWQ